jgi:hypothetical protein
LPSASLVLVRFIWAGQGELQLASKEDGLGCEEKNEHPVLSQQYF